MSEHRYDAEFACGARAALTLSLAGMTCEWSPGFPRELSGQRRRKFLAAYRAWRDECIADFGKRTGRNVVIVDL